MIRVDKKIDVECTVYRLWIGKLAFGFFTRPTRGVPWTDLTRYAWIQGYWDGSWHIRLLWFAVGWCRRNRP